MRYDLQLRPGMTAIAAVIALSTTPAFAQALQPTVPAVEPAPVIAAPQAAPAEAAPAVSADPAPAVSSDAAAAPAVEPAVTAATAPAPVPTMQPIVHQPSAADLQAAAREARQAPAKAAPTVSRAAPTVSRTATPAAAPVAAAPTASTQAPAPVAEPAPVARTAPAPMTAERTSTTATADNDALPYIGGGVIALLLAGGATALFRRRRRDDELVENYDEAPVLDLNPAPATLATPVFARTPQAAMAPAGATTLPSGFDISQFGRHTQAAYRGPTPDNPSMSLRKRLKRASFFDGRERLAAETGTAPIETIAAPAAIAARTAKVPASEGQIVVRPRLPNRASFFPSFARQNKLA